MHEEWDNFCGKWYLLKFPKDQYGSAVYQRLWDLEKGDFTWLVICMLLSPGTHYNHINYVMLVT